MILLEYPDGLKGDLPVYLVKSLLSREVGGDEPSRTNQEDHEHEQGDEPLR